jgi:hypothetical protein
MRGPEGREPLSDELLCYGIEMAPVYRCLRRLVGQLAGIAVLALSGQSPSGDPSRRPDPPTLAAAGEALREARDQIFRASVPPEQRECHQYLQGCVADLEWVIFRLRNPGLGEARNHAWPPAVSIALDRAYRALKSAANQALGFSLIDARQSCCCPASDFVGTHVHLA